MKQKSFVLYADALEIWEKLTDEQAGKLILALLRLVNNGEEPSFDDLQLDMMYSFVSQQIKRDLEKYERVCEARSAAGKKGGGQIGNQNALKDEKRAKRAKRTKRADTNTDTDTVTETNTNTDTNTVTVTEPVPETIPETASVPVQPTPHPTNTHPTNKEQKLTIEEILERTRERGYAWSREEAESFLRFNEERGRTGDWDFAIERWESRRYKNPPAPEGQGEKRSLGSGMLSDADYESLMNRF